MAMDDNESSGSRVAESSAGKNRQQQVIVDVYNEVLRRLEQADHPEAREPSFDEQLWAHFNRLPARYATDVNVERAEEVLMHKRLLHLARDPANRPAIEVKLVQVLSVNDGNSGDSVHSRAPRRGSIHPLLAFGSSPNLEALAHEADGKDSNCTAPADAKFSRPMHEITFSTDDKPKILSMLTSLLAEVGLNIQEAHAFSTVDGYSLDVFVVVGWPFEEVEQLRSALQKGFLKFEKISWPSSHSLSPINEHEQIEIKLESDHVKIHNDGTDVWEIDPQFLKFESKIASGSYGDLYKAAYHSQEVAIKILKTERLNTELQKEFAQEVYIMRKVRHRNVVQFIGACTKPPHLCIVTEFMSGGSVYDFLHKQKGTFKLPALIKVAIDVSKGMNYLHHNNIIHRDLKAANLLMDENEVVKVADFGVARVKAQTGVMTAETGTYRWMAPEDLEVGYDTFGGSDVAAGHISKSQIHKFTFLEVIEHKPYDHKADVFSFGVVLWELLTGKIPYEYMTPLQAAVGVVQKGLRPTIPKNAHPKLVELLERCWLQDPALRPDFSEVTETLQQISKEVGTDGEDKRKDKSGGFFSSLRRHH